MQPAHAARAIAHRVAWLHVVALTSPSGMRLRRKISIAFFLVSSLISVLLALFLYRFIERQLEVELKARLRDLAVVGAHAIDLGAYSRLSASVSPALDAAEVSEVEGSPDYKRISDQLNAIRAAEERLVRYVYVLMPGDDPDHPRFVVDADVLAGGEDEQLSHFNQPYDVSTIPGLKRALAECTPVIEDDFVWDPEFKVYSVSAYVPIAAPRTAAGGCAGVLGVDITDRDMRAALDDAGGLAIKLSLAVIVLSLIVSIVMGTILTRSITSLTATVQRFSEKDFTARTAVATRDEIGTLGSSFNTMAETIQHHSDNLEHLVDQRTAELAAEKQTSERLLLNVLPAPIAVRLMRGEGVIVDRFDDVSVLFADIVGFTALSSRTTPEALVTMLDELFTRFDRLAETHGLEKIKTIGDAYMVVAGIPTPRPDHAQAIARMGIDMLKALAEYRAEHGIETLEIRIGIHTGAVVAGVIGRKKFIYDLWGDTVNTASRMESQGVPGRVHVSHDTAEILRGSGFELEPRGSVDIKGKGTMSTYLVVGAS
jgi:class 3 adenylate cyclase